jgi:hypothetical protein
MDLKRVKLFRNMTPHMVAFLVGDTFIKIHPSGEVVRVNQRCESVGDVLGIPVSLCSDGEIRGLPEPEEGVVIIVSSVVAKAARREDVLSPDTSDDGAIRDGQGNIIGVKRLQMFL